MAEGYNLILIIHNVRSAHNVGSMLRTAEGLGLKQVFLTGYTPYPESPDDTRLPHIRAKVSRAIHKTALGAEDAISWAYVPDLQNCLNELRAGGFQIIALEQTPKAKNLGEFNSSAKKALVVGNEITGLPANDLRKIDAHVQIPMHGKKESYNVAVAAAIALYHLTYLDK
jgi:23S rRNA (guanosine2251-2'-O)-methyltransferase